MSLEAFYVSSINPNNSVGGGGCACSEAEVTDCEPPYAIFPGSEMANNLSPHCVVCLKCAERFVQQAAIECLAAGEDDEVLEGTAIEISLDEYHQISNPTVDAADEDFVPTIEERVLDAPDV